MKTSLLKSWRAQSRRIPRQTQMLENISNHSSLDNKRHHRHAALAGKADQALVTTPKHTTQAKPFAKMPPTQKRGELLPHKVWEALAYGFKL
ncbi:MAG: hypothetical protein VYA34_13505 [Myxococcota bacterium]|nr:hypothetical protein [Myxococcota bacterium]